MNHRPAKASAESPLFRWRLTHGIGTYFVKNYTLPDAWLAFVEYPPADPEGRSFTRLVADYSMAALRKRGLVVNGKSALDACQKLATLNGLPAPPMG